MDNKYYNQINEAILSYENYKPWHDKTIDWICNRIDWAWKWRKINEDQMKELSNRIIEVMNQ